MKLSVEQRLQAYADFLKNPPPPPPGTMSIGPLYEIGANATAQSIGATLDLILKGEDGKLMQWTEGNEALRKALGLKT